MQFLRVVSNAGFGIGAAVTVAMLLGRKAVEGKLDATVSVWCPVAGFGISSVEFLGYISRQSVTYDMNLVK